MNNFWTVFNRFAAAGYGALFGVGINVCRFHLGFGIATIIIVSLLFANRLMNNHFKD